MVLFGVYNVFRSIGRTLEDLAIFMPMIDRT